MPCVEVGSEEQQQQQPLSENTFGPRIEQVEKQAKELNELWLILAEHAPSRLEAMPKERREAFLKKAAESVEKFSQQLQQGPSVPEARPQLGSEAQVQGLQAAEDIAALLM